MTSVEAPGGEPHPARMGSVEAEWGDETPTPNPQVPRRLSPLQGTALNRGQVRNLESTPSCQ